MNRAANLQPSIRPGVRVHERYRVERIIGAGGMGAVYEAIDERLVLRVALKESFANDWQLKRQFEREARLLAGLRHSALPKVTDYFIENDHAFLVMEFIEGASLAEVITNQAPLPAHQVIAWADQVLDVLTYLHSTDRRIVHRDIKPHNLRVTSSGVISLLDFGLAKVTEADSAAEGTESRSVYGYTRWYSPLEQIENSGTNERSDIYALGATLYHLLTGVRPEDAAKRDRLIAATGVDCLQRADSMVPAVGEDLALIIERAMALHSGDRYETAEEFREALRRLGRVGNVNDVDLVVHRPRHGHRRRFVQLTAAAAALIFTIALAAHVLRDYAPSADLTLPDVAANAVTSSQVMSKQKVTATSATRLKTTPEKTSPQPSAVANYVRDTKAEADNKPVANVIVKAKNMNEVSARPLPARLQHQQIETPARAKAPAIALKPRQQVAARDNDSPQVFRAPDGTEVVKFRDGRIRVSGARDH
jgi:serine/threonine protein kinase